jgi:hypothetical protein
MLLVNITVEIINMNLKISEVDLLMCNTRFDSLPNVGDFWGKSSPTCILI